MIKRGDIVVFALLLIAECFLLAASTREDAPANSYTVAYGGVSETFSLAEPREFTVNGVTIECDGATVRVTQSTCRDQICVRTKPVGASGKLIACVPNKVTVAVNGGIGGFDAVTR